MNCLYVQTNISDINLNPRELSKNTAEHNSTRISTDRPNDASGSDMVSNCDPIIDSSETNMVTISKETYKKLCNASVELYKAKDLIEKLNTISREKDFVIEKLKKEISHKGTYTKYAHFSPVNIFYR